MSFFWGEDYLNVNFLLFLSLSLVCVRNGSIVRLLVLREISSSVCCSCQSPVVVIVESPKSVFPLIFVFFFEIVALLWLDSFLVFSWNTRERQKQEFLVLCSNHSLVC